MDIAFSIDEIPIRLTTERWFHIVESHDDVAGHYDNVLTTVENPDFILRGYKNSLVAIRGVAKNHYLNVIYKQLTDDDGFIITAYFTRKVDRKKAIWTR